jgi:basic membrane lipoprotein Med (substrate-binding protein (PBP1-ABC) superfamily)
MKRYDVAIAAAVLAADAGTAAQRVAMNDVSTGGIALSSFHVELPAGFQTSIEAIIATLRAGPPRATPAPPSAPPSAGGSPTS